MRTVQWPNGEVQKLQQERSVTQMLDIFVLLAEKLITSSVIPMLTALYLELRVLPAPLLKICVWSASLTLTAPLELAILVPRNVWAVPQTIIAL